MALKCFLTEISFTRAKIFLKIQSKSRSNHSCDLDLYWIEIHFSTREPDLYKKLFQSHDDTQDNNTIKNISSSNWKCKMCRIV